MLSVIKTISAFELKAELWSGATDTWETIAEENKLQELMDLLAELYPEPVDITTINDLLWFDDDFIFEHLGMEIEDDYTSSKGL